MVILIDTNVVLDIILNRLPYCVAAAEIFKICAMKRVTGYCYTLYIKHILYLKKILHCG